MASALFERIADWMDRWLASERARAAESQARYAILVAEIRHGSPLAVDAQWRDLKAKRAKASASHTRSRDIDEALRRRVNQALAGGKR